MEALKSLLVHVDAGPHAEARVRLARRLAQQCDAPLTAAYAARPVGADLPIGMEVAAGGGSLRLIEELDRARMHIARAVVERLAREAGAPLGWEETRGVDPVAALARRALYADLLVLGQCDPRAGPCGIPPDFVESVVIESGTPALVVPCVEVEKTLGERVVVAWKETPSTARAVRAALPFLRRARDVHVISWGGREEEGASIGAWLARHGIEARFDRSAADAEAVGERLLARAADLSADLLVMGCYGHTRAREYLLGGVTRTLLESMTLPVLMAH